MDDDGLFHWSDYDDRLKNTMKDQASLNDEKLHMVGYLIEICYDLALAESRNVSESPGFEKFLLRELTKSDYS